MGPPGLGSSVSRSVGLAEAGQNGQPPSVEAEQSGQQPSSTLKRAPFPPPQVHLRPWWFPVEEMRHPVTLYLESDLADEIFGANQDNLYQLQWMSQALLHVTKVAPGTVTEINIFGRPPLQNRMKSFFLSLAAWYRELHVQRAEKIRQLEEFLKTHES
ncbi:oocyte-expressed protein homolog [Thomomys bottae]